ncbi:hypothetical protein [Acidiferrimicrobium sp. IK]|nr:hypothetical protein [Acidiferrimicrobium sp. IK]
MEDPDEEQRRAVERQGNIVFSITVAVGVLIAVLLVVVLVAL